MALLPNSKEVLNEMLRVQQALRKTSPNHALSEADRKAVEVSLDRAERAVALMRKEVR
jgi:rRNA maturation endonuclease Nob1